MTVRDLLTALQTLPWDAELLAFEAGCEGEVGEVERQGGRVYLHLGARRGTTRRDAKSPCCRSRSLAADGSRDDPADGLAPLRRDDIRPRRAGRSQRGCA
jgi:hypothetical protein